MLKFGAMVIAYDVLSWQRGVTARLVLRRYIDHGLSTNYDFCVPP